MCGCIYFLTRKYAKCRFSLNLFLIPYIYSPVARGFLAGQHHDKPPTDWRADVPYFSEKNLKENATLVQQVETLAAAKGVTLAQLSLAWVINQGSDVFPIPGTTNLKHLEDNVNASNIMLTTDEADKIACAAAKIKGERGNENYMKMTYNAFEQRQ